MRLASEVNAWGRDGTSCAKYLQLITQLTEKSVVISEILRDSPIFAFQIVTSVA